MRLINTLAILLFVQFSLSQNADFAQNRIIVSFNDTKSLNSINDIESIDNLNFLFDELQIGKIRQLDKAYSKSIAINNSPLVFVFDESIEINTTIERLKNTGLFTYVERDYINYGSGFKLDVTKDLNREFRNTVSSTTPNDTFFSRQWSLNNDGTFALSPATVDADIDMVEAWDITTGNPNIIMAVMDSGIRMSHPEFAGRLWENPNETVNGVDDDLDGYIDDINGYDFVNEDNFPGDDHGHGTNVTGIATATGNNGIGYAGVDWLCDIMPLKVLNNNNSGFTSDIIESFYYAISKNVKIISISIGGSGFSTAYQTAVDTAYNNGIVVVACMMNFNNSVPYYPAAFTNTIAVGSTDPNDERTEPFFWSASSGSNYGPHIDVVAPGNYMYGLSFSSNTNYNTYWGGTSQATPLVSGICSLLLSINPNLTVDEIRSILRNTAEDQVGDAQDTPGWDQYYGAGRVNAFNALQLLSVGDYSFNDLSIYPNPVIDNLTISGVNINDIKGYRIISINGQVLKNDILKNSSIDCSFLTEGIYFIELSSLSTGKEIIKFAKQ